MLHMKNAVKKGVTMLMDGFYRNIATNKVKKSTYWINLLERLHKTGTELKF